MIRIGSGLPTTLSLLVLPAFCSRGSDVSKTYLYLDFNLAHHSEKPFVEMPMRTSGRFSQLATKITTNKKFNSF